MESSLVEKGLGVLLGERLDMTWPGGLAAHKPNLILGCKSDVANRARQVILPCSVLVSGELTWGTASSSWGCQHRKNTGLLEQVQRRSLKMIRGMEHLFKEHKLRELGLFQPGEDLGRVNLIPVFKWG